jgi:segregation and condensation protein B
VDRETLTAGVEAILLTAGGPVTVSALVEAIDDSDADPGTIEDVLASVATSWDRPDSGLRLEHVAGGWRCITPAELDGLLRSYHGIVARQRLSQAALEVLAIVAHRQPVTLPEINFIRGTNSASVVRTLLERKLLRLAGRKKVVGKPFLYRTSKEFLVHFGLDRPEDLPDPEEMVKDETSSGVLSE